MRILLLIFGLLLAGCNKAPNGLSVEFDNFEKLTKEGLVQKKSYLFSYNETTCQRISNKERRTIHLQTDNQESYVNIRYKSPSVLPVAKEKIWDMEIIYKKSGSSSERVMSLPMVELKKEGRKMWFWNEEQKIGLIIYI